MEVRVRAPAKINWTLAVKGRRPDGFHEIDTVMQTISLADRLIVIARRRPLCLIDCDMRGVPRGRTNLIHKAWRLMRREFPGRIGGIFVDLEKEIPHGAGLGGGSSNGAATLVALNRLYGLRQTHATLAELAAELGSDVPFFLSGGVARCRGRGEKVEMIKTRMPPAHLVVVYPGFRSPTAKAYANLKPREYERRSTAPAAARALKRRRKGDLIAAMKNTFEASLEKTDRRYAEVKSVMHAARLERPMISGSGSAVFAIARSRAHAVKAAKRISAFFPQTHAVRTLRSGVLK